MAARGNVSCGIDLHFAADLPEAIISAGNAGYKFVTVDISHPRSRQECLLPNPKSTPMPFSRSDLVLPSQDWSSLVTLRVSKWIDVDSPVESFRKTCEKVLYQELCYAAHVGVPAILVDVRSRHCVNLARMLHNYIMASTAYQLMFQAWLVIPMEAPSVQSQRHLCSLSKEDRECDNDDNNNLDRISHDEDPWEWAHQAVIHQFFKLGSQLIVDGSCRHEHMRLYYQYLDHLFNTQPPDDPLCEFAKGFEDYLQTPLQPLMDNLESVTYEIFEKDPVKYTEYQRAMYLALMDKGAEVGKDTEIILMVLGAGRGPLVRAALNAAESASQKVRLYAIEKNPNAVITLLTQKAELWKDLVTVVSCDMRDFEAPEKADILVSELLGSFGDNELSPECLDGAQRFLKDDGISIPCQYSSYLSPLQSYKLYTEVAALREKDKHPLTPYEVPYVVRLHNVTELSEHQHLFTFVHPNKDKVVDNSRYKFLRFKIKDTNVLHGFAGYFDTVLYKDVTLSICPNSHSPGMFSWFPIFFPIKEPIRLQKGAILEVHFWRCVTPRKVWYEWLVSEPEVGTVHNPCGRSYTIGL
ncbi:protein arginine N-methyltransferase 5 isoform X3 [Dermacentor variabilis]|uniref:protein arginine N-methyltransferase 5 isoform X3 n=1 Tax=Dermacentor variabilis TaxID=34621 RepID=UPI003F5C7ED9